MASRKRNTAQIPPANSTVTANQAARFALAEKAASEDLSLISSYEMVVGAFASISPSEVGKLLNRFSVEQIASFLRQIPECSDPALAEWGNRYLQFGAPFDIAKDVERLESL